MITTTSATKTLKQLQAAVEQHRRGELSQAEAVYRQILRDEPKCADAMKLLGIVCAQTDRHQEGLDWLERAASQRPDDATIHYNLGNALQRLGLMEQAVERYKTAITCDDRLAMARRKLGAVLVELGRCDEAIVQLAATVDADPSDHEALFHLALAHVGAGAYDRAERALRDAIAIAPQCAELHHNLGEVLYRLDRFDESIESYQQALSHDPALWSALSNLAAVLTATGRIDEAIECCRKAIEHQPKFAEAHSNLAQALLCKRAAPEAIDAALEALQLNPTLTAARRTLAGALQSIDKHDEAIKQLQTVCEQEPNSADVNAKLADALRTTGRFDECEIACERALAIEAQHAPALLARAKMFSVQGRAAQASEIADRLYAAHPDRIDVALWQAVNLRQRGQLEDALRVLEPFIDRTDLRHREKQVLQFELGAIHDKLGRYDEAFQTFESGNRLHLESFDRDACAEQFAAIQQEFSAERMANLPRAQQDSNRPIFIVGMPRSGTTLLEQILSSHPDVFGAGELEWIWQTAVSMAGAIGSNKPYPRCVTELSEPSLNQMASDYLAHLESLSPDHARVTDKSLRNVMHLGLIALMFPRACVIHCQRDPLDVCLSCYFTHFDGEHRYAYDLADLGFYYRQYDSLMDHWRRVESAPAILDVRYDELVNDPHDRVAAILEFCGLPFDDRCLQFHENSRPVQTASSDQVRRPMYRSSLERHRHYSKHLQPLREALGMGA